MEARQLLELAADDGADSATDTGVNFVENDGGDAAALGLKAFQGEHHTGKLATGGGFSERQRGLAEIRREEKFGGIGAVGTERNAVADDRVVASGERNKARGKDRTAHPKGLELGFHTAFEFLGVALAAGAEIAGANDQVVEQSGAFGFDGGAI